RGVVLRQIELRQPLLARLEGRRRRLVDIAQRGLPELGEEPGVRTVEGQIDSGCHDWTVLRASDNHRSVGPGPARGRWALGQDAPMSVVKINYAHDLVSGNPVRRHGGGARTGRVWPLRSASIRALICGLT